LAPPPAEFWSARVGAPARQPDLVRASRKTDGGAAEGSTRPRQDPRYQNLSLINNTFTKMQ